VYKTIILPVVLCGCETWSLTLRKEYRLRVFENRVLRRTFGPKRDEVTGDWRKLHNVEFHNLYSSPNIIRTIKSMRMRWAGHVAQMGPKLLGCISVSFPLISEHLQCHPITWGNQMTHCCNYVTRKGELDFLGYNVVQ
jgi:hypothetical protein